MELWVLITANPDEWDNEGIPSKTDLVDILQNLDKEDILDWVDDSDVTVKLVEKA